MNITNKSSATIERVIIISAMRRFFSAYSIIALVILLATVFGVYYFWPTPVQHYKLGDTLTSQQQSPSQEQPHAYFSIEAKAPTPSVKAITWDDLMPADWDPMKILKGLDLSKLQDTDPAAIEALSKVREIWNNAPINPQFNNVSISIEGFVVPLDMNGENVTEFLLVPYFGACIHAPPPPSNQVIHITGIKHITNAQQKILNQAASIQGPISLKGMIKINKSDTFMGFASYEMQADTLDEYKQTKN